MLCGVHERGERARVDARLTRAAIDVGVPVQEMLDGGDEALERGGALQRLRLVVLAGERAAMLQVRAHRVLPPVVELRAVIEQHLDNALEPTLHGVPEWVR